MDVKVYLDKDKTDDLAVRARGGGRLDDYLDFYVPGGKVEFFVPVARSVEVAEGLLRAGIDLLKVVREREAASECPTTAPDS